MIASGIDPGMFAEAQSLFNETVRVGEDPNHVTYTVLVDSFFKNGYTEAAFNLQSQMVTREIAFDVVVFTALIDGLFKSGKFREAEDMFNIFLESNILPSIVTYSTLIDGHTKLGDMKGAESAMQEMQEKHILPNVVTYSSVIDGYVKNGILEDGCLKADEKEVAKGLYEDMKMRGVDENIFILDVFMNNLKDEAEMVYKDWLSRGLIPDHVNYTPLMDVLFKAGKVSHALELVEEGKAKDIALDTTTYNVFA
ncbi:uncharacterized protein [Henckelia pumila]|uniref:uncharacterized protein isoform X2 n=1 Tax=Henckelia pumila TaxID=405737 RepID=UPI003C6E85A8